MLLSGMVVVALIRNIEGNVTPGWIEAGTSFRSRRGSFTMSRRQCTRWFAKGRIRRGNISAAFILHALVCKKDGNLGSRSVDGAELKDV